MKKICPGITCGAIFALLYSAVMLAGCSYTAMPKNVPTITGSETMSLSGVSVIVTNAEKDAMEYKILTDGKDDSGFRANRLAWSSKARGDLGKRTSPAGRPGAEHRSRKAESRTAGDNLYREQNGVPVQGKGRYFVVQGVVENV